ncbi:MAG: peptidylprolyl isomerase, partial [Candidatus Eisenbacteria bacterium]|nr:peptidylprolyl isomerase [Candidatus Eisenbacteria bacterium]
VVSDADVQKQFEEHRGDIGKKPRALRVLDLFVRISPDSTIERTYRQKAQDIYEEIQKGLAFDEAARRYSDDENSRDQGGLLGRFGPGDLGDRNFESRAFTLPIGEVSRPIRTNLGYHLIQVMDRDSSGAWAQVRHILVKITPTRSDESRTRARVDEIRKEIVSGAIDFAEAVRKYSDDPATRQTGGDVGWLPIDNFLGDTQGAVDSLRVGQISRPAKVEGGFHLFKLLGEQAETDYTFDEVRDQLRAMVERDERQKKLEAYIAELRNKTFVEVRRNP